MNALKVKALKSLAIAVGLVLLGVSGVSAAQNRAPIAPAHKSTPVSAAKTVRAPSGQIWVDVRTPDEYAGGHVLGALNITPQEISERIGSIAPNKNTSIHLYCRSGRRAEVARQTLLSLGYTDVINHGGYQDVLNELSANTK